jgi:hypothetical protein
MYQARTSPVPRDSTEGKSPISPEVESAWRADQVAPPSVERRAQTVSFPCETVAPSYSTTSAPFASAVIALWPG